MVRIRRGRDTHVAGRADVTPDNGNGSFTIPLFYEEFSDPDLIRGDEGYYLTGTTMHSMPSLPVLQLRVLVNWTLVGFTSFASEALKNWIGGQNPPDDRLGTNIAQGTVKVVTTSNQALSHIVTARLN